MNASQKKGTLLALLAAALYALSAPLSKLLLTGFAPTMLAGFLYLGAGGGMLLLGKSGALRHNEKKLTRADLPYTLAMVALDVAAPIFLLMGLNSATAANVSLLNNFEIVATALIALLIFHEKISARLWISIALVTCACALLSLEEAGSFTFSLGSLLVLLAAVCWGLENNCTRKLSGKDPLQIVVVKGFGSGCTSLLIAFFLGEKLPAAWLLLCALLLGFVAYGLSIYFYVYAQRTLGAAKTSAYYAAAPFIGALLSLLIFRSPLGTPFLVALPLMALGAYFAATDV